MRLASRHGTPSWEALLGRLVLCAALCVCRADDDLVPVQFRASPRCSALCSRAQTPACSAPPAALPFCSHLPMDRLLAGRCQARLPHALHRDALACQLACEFQALLSRFDCLGGYSAKWDCHTCAVSSHKKRGTPPRSSAAHRRCRLSELLARMPITLPSKRVPLAREHHSNIEGIKSNESHAYTVFVCL